MVRLLCLLILSWEALAQMQTPDAAPPPAGKGRIEGNVVDSVTHEPLKKAQVSLGGPMPSPTAAVTDAAGRFEFRDLPPGDYWLNSQKNGYNPPHGNFGGDANRHVPLAAGEEKTGIRIELAPTGFISGHVLDVDGSPVRRCSVTAVPPDSQRIARHRRGVSGSAAPDDRGEYRISNLAPGRYVLLAQCREELPVAHPLLARDDPHTPYETYAQQFYGAGADAAMATPVHLAPGANLEGIDFEMRRVLGFTLRGTVTGVDPESAGQISVNVFPADRLLGGLLMRSGSGLDPATRTFQIHGVSPGSYMLVASGNYDGHWFRGQRTVEVGATAPEPVEISISAGADLKGTVQFDSDEHPVENSQIFLAAVEEAPGFYAPQTRAEIGKDGSFTLTGVLPGRWRASFGGMGYVKSLALGDQPVSPFNFQIPPGAMGPLRVVVGTKMSDVKVTVTGSPSDRQVSVLLYPDDLDRLGIGVERTEIGYGEVDVAGVQPGRYRLLATSMPNPWALLERPDVLKALESGTEAIDVPEGGHVNATTAVVSREDLARALDQE